MSDGPQKVPDWVPEKMKQVVADAIVAEETKLTDARAAGVAAARKLAGYHNPDEPRTNSEGEGDAQDVPPAVAAPESSLPGPEPEAAPVDAVPRARRSDPQTSHDAARSIPREDLRASQAAIRSLLHFHGPMTDPEIALAYQTYAKREGFPEQSESGLRTRRDELVKAGFVVDSGETKRLPSGRNAIIWKETLDVQPVGSGKTPQVGDGSGKA